MLDGNKVQFEDQRTRHVQVMKLSVFYAEVMSKKIQPVIGNITEISADEMELKAPTLISDISSLNPKEQTLLERRMNWVKSLRKRGITRGQRGKIEKAIPAVAESLHDSDPPSVSTLVVWMRKYDISCRNPAALLSGHRSRRRNRRVHPFVDELIVKKLRSVYLTRARHTLRHVHEQILLSLKKLVETKKIDKECAQVSMATLSRRLSEFGPYELAKARYGVGYARARFRTSVEGSLAVRAMQRLECDHTLLNWVVICDRTGLPLGRPTLTIVVDSMSGYGGHDLHQLMRCFRFLRHDGGRVLPRENTELAETDNLLAAALRCACE